MVYYSQNEGKNKPTAYPGLTGRKEKTMKNTCIAATMNEDAYYDALYAKSLDAYGQPITDDYAAYCSDYFAA